jgi:hypothetical protein
VETFMGPRRFWLGGQSVLNAYELSGSLVGVLLERFGAEAVRRWYAGASPEEAFGRDLEALDDLWRSRLGELETREVEQRQAGRRLEEGAKGAVHRARCGRLRPCDEGSRRLEAYRIALSAQDWEEVLRLLEDPSVQEAVFPPGLPGALSHRAWILERAHRGLGTPEEALGPVEELLEALPPEGESRGRFVEILLRLELAADREGEARERLERGVARDPALARELGWLPEALDAPDREEALAVFLETDPLRRAERAAELLERHPEWPGLARWTWRRQLWLSERVERALALGEELRAGGEEIPSGPLALLHEGRAGREEDAGRLAAARESWRAAEELREEPLARARAREQQERLAWRLDRLGRSDPSRDRGGR